MAKRFIQIFWGLLLVVVDFRINQFDVLPDALGYILVALGCRGLKIHSQRFSSAADLAWISVALAVASDILSIDFPGFGLLCSAVNCAVIWYLLGGVIELANSRKRRDLSVRASNRRLAYVTIVGITTFVGMFDQHGVGLGLAAVAGMLVVLCLILHLIHRAINELSDGPRWQR